MTDSKPQYADSSDAPTMYFDGVACHGVMHGVIQIEIAGRVMIPRQDGGVDIKFVPTGRLRCSAEAARALRQSLDIALSMAEHPEQRQLATKLKHPEQRQPAAATKLN